MGRVKQLTTKLPNFSQQVGDLRGSVQFGKIDLESSNFPIQVKVLICLSVNGVIRLNTTRFAVTHDH